MHRAVMKNNPQTLVGAVCHPKRLWTRRFARMSPPLLPQTLVEEAEGISEVFSLGTLQSSSGICKSLAAKLAAALSGAAFK
mmetsp:Transcript_97626/g.262342  ORF Transcript_97626/g.262342 Transcript_97626/m.262342 type:complete len:81 (+) Transcript_97626:2-244(+)